MQSLHGITQSDPEILNGEPVFVGTRVPVRLHWFLDCYMRLETQWVEKF
ncbi:MAG: DUF433 domain-containing protein [Planctomycetota bacterium]|nr:DUF433 domain-containing protein [Planctomycetota bacterium]